MPAHTRKIIQRKCPCGKKAIVEVYSTHNAFMGYFCTTCGNRRVKKLNEVPSDKQPKW